MNMLDLLYAIRDAILADKEIAAWCQITYQNGPYLYIGADEDNPPEDDHYPVIHLFPVSKPAGRIPDEERIHTIGATCGIKDSSLISNPYSNVVEYAAISRIVEFVNLLTACLKNIDSIGDNLKRVNTDFEPLEYFPYILAMNIYEFEIFTQFREDPFA